jgi:hypothetical protein
VYNLFDQGNGPLYFRSLTEHGVGSPIEGTEKALCMFLSPKGNSVAFYTLDGLLKAQPSQEDTLEPSLTHWVKMY